MVFSSIIFLFYFLPVALLLYYIVPARFRNLTLVIESILFYTWGAPKYIFVVLAAMLVDFFLAKKIHSAEGSSKKRYLIFALSINIGALLYFKYFNFFIDNINDLFLSIGFKPYTFLKVALPIGISFFTFHEISYLVDVYRAKKMPFNRITDYALYILFFPQLIAGPIIRFNEISDQISNNNEPISYESRLIGLFRFLIGLSKKILIANVCGAKADLIFSLPDTDLSTPIAWIGALAYTFQIYFDFSGYSDMAIGLARMMGFVFPENFNNPYVSQNITEFWRRWHMTLSRWIRDYLYISLGGNKVSINRTYLNLVICFLVSGFWHGAEWTFIFWGAYHGLFLILDRLFLIKALSKLGKLSNVLFTFFITLIGWVFFRADSIADAIVFLQKMFSWTNSNYTLLFNKEFVFTMLLAIIFSFFTFTSKGQIVHDKLFSPKPSVQLFTFLSVASIVLIVLLAGSIVSTDFNPFIYFRF
jgi:alginate O-acetyltransferase complex protein AlgI